MALYELNSVRYYNNKGYKWPEKEGPPFYDSIVEASSSENTAKRPCHRRAMISSHGRHGLLPCIPGGHGIGAWGSVKKGLDSIPPQIVPCWVEVSQRAEVV